MGIKLESFAKQLKFDSLGDERGELIALEQWANIPFEIRRVYYIFQTEKDIARGFHAHKRLKQVAIAVSGSCEFDIETADGKASIVLNSPKKGLYLNGLVWREMRNFSEDCVLIVLASEVYDEEDYIRNYSDFKVSLKNLGCP